MSSFWSVLGVVPLGVVLIRFSLMRDVKKLYSTGALILFFTVAVIRVISARSYSNDFSVNFDALFVFTAFSALIFYINVRENKWLALLCLHLIAWCASISWGYQTTMLYSSPAIMTLFAVYSDRYNFHGKAAAALLIFCFLFIFCSNKYYYSLEGGVARSDLKVDLGGLSNYLSYLKGSQNIYLQYKKAIFWSDKFKDKNIVFLPNMPILYVITGRTSISGSVWPMNAEIGNKFPMALKRVEQGADYAVVRRQANPSPELEGKFGSDLTLHVTNNWEFFSGDEYFDIYKNTKR